MSAEKYPEHARQSAILSAAQLQGELLEWLSDMGYVIARWDDTATIEPRLTPARKSIVEWLAEFHGIDLDKIEAEKRQMLDELRAGSGPAT